MYAKQRGRPMAVNPAVRGLTVALCLFYLLVSGGGAALAQGDVSIWGSDIYGALGDGRRIAATVPGPVPSLNAGKNVAAGLVHCLAAKTDGTVWSWGGNDYGQLGDGTTDTRTAPARVMPLANVTAVSCGSIFSLALKSDGTVWGWGYNNDGQMGTGENGQHYTPVQATISSVSAISAGDYHALALKSNGTVWAWGYNDYGQLGDGTTNSRYTPVQVPNLASIIAVVAGGRNSLALRSDGTVLSWGANYDGQLGDGTNVTRLFPVRVVGVGGTGFLSAKTTAGTVAIATGYSVSLAIKSDGTAVAWGYGGYGTLGNGSYNSSTTPVAVSGLTNVSKLFGGANTYHVLAVLASGAVKAWGDGGDGELGDGTYNYSSSPVDVANLSATTAACGRIHCLAVRTDGAVMAWGGNVDGELGDGVPLYQSSPPTVFPFTNAIAISAGQDHTLALDTGHTVWAWGGNYAGQLGINSFTPGESTPTQVPGIFATAISAGGQHSLILKSDGTVTAWGSDIYGQMGVGNYDYEYSFPVDIPNFSGVAAIAAGGSHSLALKSDGTVWSWGYNFNGQLGDGTTANHIPPARITTLPAGIAAIAAGSSHSLALTSGGLVYAWGANFSGQLGDGTFNNSNAPVLVPNLTGVIAISAGDAHSFALKSDGTVMAWGADSFGQLGDGNYLDEGSPVAVTGLTDVAKIAAGYGFSLALKTDGTVWSWGDSTHGQLGQGFANASFNTPAQVPGLVNQSLIAGGGSHALSASGFAATNINAPTELTLQYSASTYLGLQWRDNSANENHFSIEEKTTGNFAEVATVGANDETSQPIVSAFIFGLTPETTYSFRVRAVNGAGSSNPSNTITLTTGPKPPTNFTATTAGDTKINLAWTNNSAVATGFYIFRYRLNPITGNYDYEQGMQLPASPLTYTDTGLLSGTRYIYYLYAIDSAFRFSDGVEADTLTTGPAPALVSGKVTFEAIDLNADAQYVTFEFRTPGTTNTQFIASALVAPNGTYQLAFVPHKKYDVRAKSAKYLAKVFSLNATAGNVTNANVTLLGGDANDDNSVDNLDLGILASAYASVQGDANFDARADFNGDHSVDNIDLSILANNYTQTGDD